MSVVIRRRIDARQTSDHSSCTCLWPRRLKRLQPRAFLIHPFGVSDNHFLSAWAARPSSVARCSPIRCAASVAVDGGMLPAFAAKRHMPWKVPCLQFDKVRFIAVAGIREHSPPRHPAGLGDGCIQHGQQLNLICPTPVNRRGNDHLVLPVHNELRVEALPEPLVTGLHDRALGIREVALRLRLPERELVLAAPVGIAILVRLATVPPVPNPLLRFQTRYRRLGRR